MIVLAAALACVHGRAPAPAVSTPSPETPPPGTPVVFDEIFKGHAWAVPNRSEPCARACVDVVSSEKEWQSLRMSSLGDQDVRDPDWETENLLVAYMVLGGGGPTLEITEVWDIGEGRLQVDLTLHLTQIQTAAVTCIVAIATVPRGDYVPIANVTESRPWLLSSD